MAVNLTDAQIKKLFPTYFTSDYQGQITAAKIKKILKLYSDKEGGRTYIGDKLKLNQVVVGRILNIAENKNIIKRVDPKEFKTNKALKLYDNPADRKILNAIRPVTNIDRTKNIFIGKFNQLFNDVHRLFLLPSHQIFSFHLIHLCPNN